MIYSNFQQSKTAAGGTPANAEKLPSNRSQNILDKNFGQ